MSKLLVIGSKHEVPQLDELINAYSKDSEVVVYHGDSVFLDNLNEQIKNKNLDGQLKNNFKFYLNEVSSIIKKIEDLEKEKENLKDQLKIYEQEFINKKKDTEDKINLLTEECEILNKTINVMKNLRSI